MMFLAPRQKLFAVIILISLCLHTLFFVLSAKRNMQEHYRAVAEQSVIELSQELKVPMAMGDRISMSVIADRYLKEKQMAFVGIYDAKETLLVPVGEDSDDGIMLKESIVSGSSALGSVVLKTPSISHAYIISRHWLFLVAMTGLHTILWLLYGYFARPTSEFKEEITKEIRKNLLAKGVVIQSDSAPQHATDPDNAYTAHTAQADSGNVHDEAAYQADKNVKVDLDGHLVQIIFDDPHQLLSTVSLDVKMAYFALCDQLLDRAVLHLLELPLLTGVKAEVVKRYDDKGAKVLLSAAAPAKVATATVMLSKLMLMLNQVVYDKHREIQRFALPIRTTASHADEADAVLQLTKKRRETPLILINEKARDEVKPYAQLTPFSYPATVQERESRVLSSVTQATAERLFTVRDKVLLSE